MQEPAGWIHTRYASGRQTLHYRAGRPRLHLVPELNCHREQKIKKGWNKSSQAGGVSTQSRVFVSVLQRFTPDQFAKTETKKPYRTLILCLKSDFF
ncbi:hypothetical protein [Rheinheimera sp.]|jgi:hypothetical protein|uniref:hypothetical protein n=1 Tax=Rheinheimera sp. TaxID=1869214 RepID=UPI003D2A0354